MSIFAKTEKENEQAAALRALDDSVARELASGYDPRLLKVRLENLSEQAMKVWACTSTIGY